MLLLIILIKYSKGYVHGVLYHLLMRAGQFDDEILDSISIKELQIFKLLYYSDSFFEFKNKLIGFDMYSDEHEKLFIELYNDYNMYDKNTHQIYLNDLIELSKKN